VVGGEVTVFAAAAPVRLDLAGGWTDVPPYSAREGGVVVAAAVQLYAHAEVRPREHGYLLTSKDLDQALHYRGPDALAGEGPLPLLRAGLRLLRAAPCALSTRSDAPHGSGLGSSGAMDVALVAALAAAGGRELSIRETADLACRLEGEEAGIPGGRQDQFAAAFGGFLHLTFRDPDARVEPIALDPEFAAELERRMLLCYTGASRFSGDTIGRVMQAYERGEPKIAGALDGLRRTAEAMGEALTACDFGRVGALLSENWRLQQQLDPGMSTPEMRRLEGAMREAGCVGGKAAGSGAGGSMFFLAPDDPRPARREVLRLGMRLLPVRWAPEGVRPC
jgi:D-glycero-alpha-D-manno-heptose-7-phosphate kinase